MRSVRVVAILAAHNEERFIAACLEHLFEHGVEAYLIDNSSDDRTAEIAERYLGRGLIGMETFPRDAGVYRWEAILERKEELAATLEADWLMHVDPDEFRLPPRSDRTLAQAFAEVDEKGYNAVNFLEFTFVPTREAPDHDHLNFRETMRWYYPYLPKFPHRINAWKRQPVQVDLANSGGHRVKFPNLFLYPESFKMKHYLFLSVPHAFEKYLDRKYDAEEVRKGWHGWRARLAPHEAKLPSQEALNVYTSDEELDLGKPRVHHVLDRPHPTSRPGGGPFPAREWVPIIVGGCYRSGTSLLRRMLDAHPRIYCGPEVKFFRDFNADYLNDPIRHIRFITSARHMLPERTLLEVLGSAFVTLHERAARRAGKPRWADKNPENVLYLKEWQRLLGDDWVFVHVVRNPLDTLASIKEIEFPRVIPPDLRSRIDLYKRYTRAGLRFEKRHPGRYYRIVYERLVQDPKGVMSDFMGWLGEDFEPVQLDFNSVRHQKGLEDRKVRETIEVHAESVGRWKAILTPEEVGKISEECDPLWRKISARSDAPVSATPKYLVKSVLEGALRCLRGGGSGE